MDNRVVITGLGVISPNASSVDDFEIALREGRSGINAQILMTHKHDILVGSEGAGFANQLWLPFYHYCWRNRGKMFWLLMPIPTPIWRQLWASALRGRKK